MKDARREFGKKRKAKRKEKDYTRFIRDGVTATSTYEKDREFSEIAI